MPIAFAICFLLVVGLSEMARHGIFGLSAAEIAVYAHVGLAFGAVVLLRGDMAGILRPARESLYGRAELRWNWPRTLLGVVISPLLLIIPLAYAVIQFNLDIWQVDYRVVISMVTVQGVLIAVCVELFFREAAIKAFRENLGAMAVASILASFVFAVPNGFAIAVITGGLAAFLLMLRLIGTNILVVALIHAGLAAALAAFNELTGLGGPEMWAYAIWFTVAAVILSLTVFSLCTPRQRDLHYA